MKSPLFLANIVSTKHRATHIYTPTKKIHADSSKWPEICLSIHVNTQGPCDDLRRLTGEWSRLSRGSSRPCVPRARHVAWKRRSRGYVWARRTNHKMYRVTEKWLNFMLNVLIWLMRPTDFEWSLNNDWPKNAVIKPAWWSQCSVYSWYFFFTNFSLWNLPWFKHELLELNRQRY